MHQNMKQNNIQKTVELLSKTISPFLTMYFVFKDGESNYTIKLVDLEKSVINDFSTKFREYLIDKFSKTPNLNISSLSNADDRSYDAILYDLEVPELLKELKAINSDPVREKYSYKEHGELQLKGYIFIIGNDKVSLSFYKEHHSVDLITRDSYLIFGRRDSRFVKLTDEIYKITPTIDFLQVENDLYVLNLSVLERNFKIHDIIKKEAERYISSVNMKGFIENDKYISELINENIAFARKVLRVNKESPVMKLPFASIKTFVQNHPHLSGKLEFNGRGNKILLTTKTSANLFVKLMDDDFLKSDLTQQLYDSITKDRLEFEKKQAERKQKKRA